MTHIFDSSYFLFENSPNTPYCEFSQQIMIISLSYYPITILVGLLRGFIGMTGHIHLGGGGIWSPLPVGHLFPCDLYLFSQAAESFAAPGISAPSICGFLGDVNPLSLQQGMFGSGWVGAMFPVPSTAHVSESLSME